MLDSRKLVPILLQKLPALLTFSLGWLLLASSAASQTCLISAPSILAGLHPISVAVADFNEDGNPDMATANPPQAGVTVLLGDGTGSFHSQSIPGVGFQPWFIIAADLNRDGHQDLVVADYTYCVASIITVLLGNGDGSFQPGATYAVDKTPVSLVAMDFNKDGILDLAAANWCSGDVSVLLGNGDGTLRSSVNYGVAGALSITAADFNNDGAMDLAAMSGGGDVTLLIGNGTGSFQVSPSFSTGFNLSATGIAAADLDHDKRADLVVSNTYGGSQNVGTALVLRGNGDGTFQAPITYDSGLNSSSVLITDLNQDGVPDLALSTTNSDGVNILVGNGDGSFSYGGQFTTGDGSTAVVAGDFNKDGRVDLAVVNNGIGTTFNSNLSPGNVSLLLGNGDATFQSSRNFPAGFRPTSLASADFNNDGMADVVAGNFSGSLQILNGAGGGNFAAAASYPIDASIMGVAIGDFNRDGKLDLAVAGTHTTDGAYVLLGNGDGTFSAPSMYLAGVSPSSIAIADLNHDGLLDLVLGNYISNAQGTVNVLLGRGDGTFASPLSFPVGKHTTSVAIGDFNADGKPDIVATNFLSGGVTVLLGNGDGSFQKAVSYRTGSGPRSVAVADLNGDGKLDLVIANSRTEKVSVLIGNGDGTFKKAVNFAAEHKPNAVAVTDVNGDGKLDVVTTLSYTASHGNGSMAVLLGNGDGTLQEPTYYGTGLLPRSLVVADFNGDGRPDVATGNYTSNSITVLLNPAQSSVDTVAKHDK
jgi:hypothetical protein